MVTDIFAWTPCTSYANIRPDRKIYMYCFYSNKTFSGAQLSVSQYNETIE